MKKSLCLSTFAALAALGIGPGGHATAQSAAVAAAVTLPAAQPTTPDDCLKIAFDLAENAEERKLPEAKLDPLEELLTKMETQCDAKQFAEAMASAESIKKLIETE